MCAVFLAARPDGSFAGFVAGCSRGGVWVESPVVGSPDEAVAALVA